MYTFGWCIVTWPVFIFKGFHCVLQAFYMFLWFFFYWVDIPGFIFWMNLWILWKDTDVSIFLYSSIFHVLSLTYISICLYALWKTMHKCWCFGYAHEDSYEAEGRFSASFTILQESPGYENRGLTSAYSYQKEATANQTAVEITPKATSTFKNLTTCSSAYPIRRSSPSSTKTP